MYSFNRKNDAQPAWFRHCGGCHAYPKFCDTVAETEFPWEFPSQKLSVKACLARRSFATMEDRFHPMPVQDLPDRFPPTIGHKAGRGHTPKAVGCLPRHRPDAYGPGAADGGTQSRRRCRASHRAGVSRRRGRQIHPLPDSIGCLIGHSPIAQ